MFRPNRYLPFCAVVLSFVSAPAQAFPPDTLAEALPRTADRANRVPLLVVGAETVRQGQGEAWQKLHQLYEEQDAKPPLAEVVPHFNRQIVSCASVRVVAPPTRYGINPYPGKPEEWARIGRERATRLLFASLSSAQWKTASSERGIGLSDFSTPEQKAWFLSALPPTFTLHQVEKESGEYSGSRVVGTPVTLKPDGLRLRVVRSMSWNYKQGGGFLGFGQGENANRQPGERFWERLYSAEEAAQDKQTYREQVSKAVIFTEPNRYVSGALPMNKPPLFGKSVSLVGVKTVGELVMRIAEKTGVELYVDRRVSALSVTHLGDPDARADCADLTKALCLAITGTVRAIRENEEKPRGEAVYLLTGSQAGGAATRLALSEWASDVEALLQAEQTAFESAARSGGVAANIGFAPDSPVTIPANIMQAAEARIRNPEPTSQNHGYHPIPVSALSPAAQETVRRDLAQHAQWQSNATNALDAKNVYASFHIQTQIVAEGYGAFSGSSLASLGELLEKNAPKTAAPKPVALTGAVALPPSLTKFAALQIAPTDASEARDAANWARSRGFAALFVPMSLWDDAAPSRLAATINGAKNTGVAVYPVVSLFRVSESDAKAVADLPRTRNVNGETLREYAKRRVDAPAVRLDGYTKGQIAPLLAGDWLDAFDGAVQKAVAERLASVAATPGIGGVVLADVAAPGMQDAAHEWTNGATGARTGGYTLANRLAFVRQENIDPLDLLPGGNLQPYLRWDEVTGAHEPPPFFAANHQTEEVLRTGTAYRRGANGKWETATPKPVGNGRSPWNAMLFEQNSEVVARVRQAASLPDGLRVWAMIVRDGYGSPHTVPWETGEPLPSVRIGDASLYPFALRRDTKIETVRGNIARVADWAQKQKTFPYGGIVVDATAAPFADALRFLSAIAPAPKP